MPLPEAIGFLVLAVGWGVQILLRPLFVRRRRAYFALGVVLVVGAIGILARAQYMRWAGDPVSQFLLPPYRGWDYFLGYLFTRLIGPWCVAALAAGVVWLVARAMNRRFQGRFFEEEEPLMFAMGVFFSGYPGFFVALIAILCAGILFAGWHAMRGHGRVSFYRVWFPAALLAILTMHFAIPRALLVRFNF